MRKATLATSRSLGALSLILLLILAACGTSAPEATPTMSVDAIYTAAFYTLSAQQATQLALTPPSATPSQTSLPPTASPNAATTGVPVTGATTPAGGATRACDNAVYVNDVTIPDSTIMTPGKTFVKTWTVMNSGTCPWTNAYKLSFVSGDAMGGTAVPLTANVPAGATTQLSVSLTAPIPPGNYTGTWQLENAQGQRFGDVITVVIVVSGAPAATNTP